MIDRSLERLLSDTARGVEYPATPDLSARVVASLREGAPARRQPQRPAFGLALAVAALMLVAALAISPSRDAIARFFGVEGSRIEFLPTPLPGETATPFPTAVPTTAARPGEVVPVELADVPQLAGFDAAVPDVTDARLGSSLVLYGNQPVVMHHYERFDVWQTRLRQDAGFGKGVPEGGIVEEVMVGDVPAVWLTGAEHFVYYYDETGYTFWDSQRIVGRSTLVWRTDAFFYRIETDLSLEETLRIAETLP
jgi:hypothetical protein